MDKVKIYFKNLLISFLVCLLLLYIFSSILTYTNIKDTMLGIFVYISLVIAASLGGCLNSRKIKEKGIVHGAIFGLIYITVIYIFHCIIYSTVLFSFNVLAYYITCILAGVIGGVVGVNIG